MSAAVLAGRGLTRSFGSFVALDSVDIALRAGSIHALMGENGAGKSTLIRLLGGILQPDAGEILVDDKPVSLPSPAAAARRGIRIVHQERHLIPGFSVAENILLSRMPVTGAGLVDFAAANRASRTLLESLSIDIDPQRDVATLSPAQQQQIEIARALNGTSRVVILDEPTASLTPVEVEQLFGLLRRLAAGGVALLFVSHRIDEVYALCDVATVLRDGRLVESARPLAEFGTDDLVRAMVGRVVGVGRRSPAAAASPAPPALALSGVATTLGHASVDLVVGKGEIHGVYGLVGSGRTELARAILGEAGITAGAISVGGRAARPASMRSAVHEFSVGYVSEDRRREGLALEQPVRMNACAVVWERLASRWGFIGARREDDAIRVPLRALAFSTDDYGRSVGSLSGGNQQKVSVAKWLAAGSRLMIFDEPTVGVDVSAKATLHEHIGRLAESGCGILLISSDLAEIVALSDRISIMSAFRIVASFANSGDYADMSVRAMRAIQAAAAASPPPDASTTP
jgi:ribose transport system ATP-binding protein